MRLVGLCLLFGALAGCSEQPKLQSTPVLYPAHQVYDSNGIPSRVLCPPGQSRNGVC